MSERGVVGTGGSCGGIKSRFCGWKRAELEAAAGGLDALFGQEEGKADGRGSCTRWNAFD